jgi:hypothetical protein
LKNWFDFLDRTGPFAKPILQQLETAGHFSTWFEPYRLMIVTGSGIEPFRWPDDRRHRIGMQLHLLRRISHGEIDPGLFALIVLHTGRSIHTGIATIIEQIFRPASQDLKRYLREAITAEEEREKAAVVPNEVLAELGFGALVTRRPDAVPPSSEMITLKPGIWGMSIDLKAVARRLREWWQKRRT